jgi:hypothetical protein
MKKVLVTVTAIAFGVFAVAILGLLMTLTYQALGRIFPGRPDNQIWGLVLFDIAAIIWALAFVFRSETTMQYAIAAIGFLVGFSGTIIMVGGEVMLGQTLTETNAGEIGRWMVYGFIGATAIHAILLYAHHASGQEIKQQIDIGIAKGEIKTEAIKQAQTQLDQEKTELAQTIKAGILADAKRELGLYPVAGTPFEKKDLDTAAPSEALPYPTEEQPAKDEPTTARLPFQPE